MRILIVHDLEIPALRYGGIERVIWWLGKELVRLGHTVTYLVKEGSSCPFAQVRYIDRDRSLDEQIPQDVDLVHLHWWPADFTSEKPCVYTMHGNHHDTSTVFPINTTFVSRNHAERFGATAFVHNGVDPDDYGAVDWTVSREGLHFLAKASWSVKNLKGAIAVARKARKRLHVVGGDRLDKRAKRFTLDPRVRFYGLVGGQVKNEVLNRSEGLVFPVRWHEPFGIAVIESLYFGCPVFATPYGALPELVDESVGHLATSAAELADAIKDIDRFDRRRCHDLVMSRFTSTQMTAKYLEYYERVLAGESLNQKPPQLQRVYSDHLPWSYSGLKVTSGTAAG